MKRLFCTSLALLAFVSSGSLAARDRLSAQCRREIVSLCGTDRQAIRACLAEKRKQVSAPCRAELKERLRGGGEERPNRATGGTDYNYGADAKQSLSFWPGPAKAKRPPLMVFVHGGGWSIGDKISGAGQKPGYYQSLGFAFASLDYRLVPTVRPDDQARDIARSLAWLRGKASELGFDPDRIVLMGHSAGAHLAALVASDPRYLQQAAVPLAAIKGVVLLDGAGYDVARQANGTNARAAQTYTTAFGRDPDYQRALSPLSHAAAPNAPQWLILHVAKRDASRDQSQSLASALSAAGASVVLKPVPNSDHLSVNRDAAVAGSFVGNAISAFLQAV